IFELGHVMRPTRFPIHVESKGLKEQRDLPCFCLKTGIKEPCHMIQMATEQFVNNIYKAASLVAVAMVANGDYKLTLQSN
ncbi:hypothetical protein S245_003223, partial [Arachis hypogaea]